MKTQYTKLEPSVLTIASSSMAGQRGTHVFLNERHAAVVMKTNATTSELGKPSTSTVGDEPHHSLTSWREALLTHLSMSVGISVASRATRGIQKSKRLARTFGRPSWNGDVATKSWTGDSGKASPNMAS